jgi:hypothetical protein
MEFAQEREDGVEILPADAV